MQSSALKCLTYSLEQVKEVLSSFVLYLVRIEASSRGHFELSMRLGAGCWWQLQTDRCSLSEVLMGKKLGG